MIQIYGRFDGWWSHSQVSRGLVAGLMQNGVDLCIWNVMPGGAVDYHGFEDFGVEPLVDLNPAMDSAFYIGGYPNLALSCMRQHRRKMGLFITESSRIPNTDPSDPLTEPQNWVRCLQGYELVCTPSYWAHCAYARSGVEPKKLRIVHHGLHPVYASLAPPVSRDYLKFVHVAGAASFLDRKGTEKLVRAFCKVFSPGEAKLVLRTPLTPHVQEILGSVPGDNFVVLDDSVPSWDAMNPGDMRRFLADADVVVQPSRSEAFGMVPLEARALGRLVVLTMTTGHREHFDEERDVIVPQGVSDFPIRVNGIPEGMAPDVTVQGIASALRQAAKQARQLVPVGPDYYEKWSWKNVVKELARYLKGEEAWTAK